MKVIAKQFMILGGLLLTFNGMASQNSTVDLKYRVLVFRDSDVVVPGQRLPGGERILVAEGNLKGVPPWIGKHVPREARDILFPSVARLKMLQHSTWDIPEANATWDVFSLYRLNFWFILPTDVF
ncbi:MAG: hypothetical protein LBJ77_02845, partial [Holosporales bacterium]|nr:hypothetical protein [Holosporales bacterium]